MRIYISIVGYTSLKLSMIKLTLQLCVTQRKKKVDDYSWQYNENCLLARERERFVRSVAMQIRAQRRIIEL